MKKTILNQLSDLLDSYEDAINKDVKEVRNYEYYVLTIAEREITLNRIAEDGNIPLHSERTFEKMINYLQNEVRELNKIKDLVKLKIEPL